MLHCNQYHVKEFSPHPTGRPIRMPYSTPQELKATATLTNPRFDVLQAVKLAAGPHSEAPAAGICGRVCLPR